MGLQHFSIPSKLYLTTEQRSRSYRAERTNIVSRQISDPGSNYEASAKPKSRNANENLELNNIIRTGWTVFSYNSDYVYLQHPDLKEPLSITVSDYLHLSFQGGLPMLSLIFVIDDKGWMHLETVSRVKALAKNCTFDGANILSEPNVQSNNSSDVGLESQALSADVVELVSLAEVQSGQLFRHYRKKDWNTFLFVEAIGPVKMAAAWLQKGALALRHDVTAIHSKEWIVDNNTSLDAEAIEFAKRLAMAHVHQTKDQATLDVQHALFSDDGELSWKSLQKLAIFGTYKAPVVLNIKGSVTVTGTQLQEFVESVQANYEGIATMVPFKPFGVAFLTAQERSHVSRYNGVSLEYVREATTDYSLELVLQIGVFMRNGKAQYKILYKYARLGNRYIEPTISTEEGTACPSETARRIFEELYLAAKAYNKDLQLTVNLR